jgi:hypothetical protein
MTLFGVKISPEVVETFACAGRIPVTLTATVAVRVTLPIVKETLMEDVPDRNPSTVPLPSTSATVAAVDVKLGAGGFVMTAPDASKADTLIVCESPAPRLRLETLVVIEPSVWGGGGGGGGFVVPPPSSPPPPPQPSSADVTITQAQRVTCMRPSRIVETVRREHAAAH